MKKIAFLGIAVLSLAIMFCFTGCGEDDSGGGPGSSVTIDMVQIPPAGTPAPFTFVMGSPDTEADRNKLRESPQRTVTLTKGFRMGKYMVTQFQYKSVMSFNPSEYQGSLPVLDGVNTDNLPVERVSWYDAVDFCNVLSTLDGLVPAYDIDKNTVDPNNMSSAAGDPKYTVKLLSGTNGYRIPTEAQWEYACRAGTTTPFSTGENITLAQANYNGTPYIPDPSGQIIGTSLGRPSEVGSYAANPWGVYDMHGNLYEWCWDWIYDDSSGQGGPDPEGYQNYYSTDYGPGNLTDPTGLDHGYRKVERGGSWNHWASRIRSAWRERARPERKEPDLGFRVVLPLEGAVW